MKVFLKGTIVGPVTVERSGQFSTFEFLLQIEPNGPFAGMLATTFRVRTDDTCILFQDDRLAILGKLESYSRDKLLFYGMDAKVVQNLTRHSTWRAARTPAAGAEE